MAPPQPKTVIIVGGSLAGLMHALTLLSLPNPPKVRILERNATAHLHDRGAGIGAQAEALRFVEEYIRPGRDIAVTSRTRHYLNRKGEEVDGSIEHRAQQFTSWDILYNLLRWRVDDKAISEYVEGLKADDRPKATYEHGCTVSSVEDAGDEGVKVTWRVKGDDQPQTATVDMVLAADGPSSSIRKSICPDVERTYAGYVAWRGTVPESELSQAARDAFLEKITFYHGPGTQVLAYIIPGTNGTLKKGQRLLNWVWYWNYKEGSPELDDLMTDVNGKRHAITLPVGTMQPKVWDKQKAHAAETLPPQAAEIVQKTEQPFIQAVTDVISPRNCFFDGKLLLVGDAVAGFRPHTAASTSQAGHDALMLGEWLSGRIDRDEYEKRVMDYARDGQQRGVFLGQRSQFGEHPLAG